MPSQQLFILGPKSVSIYSCNTTTGFSFANFVLLFLLYIYLKRKIFYKDIYVLYVIKCLKDLLYLATYLATNSSVVMKGYLAS